MPYRYMPYRADQHVSRRCKLVLLQAASYSIALQDGLRMASWVGFPSNYEAYNSLQNIVSIMLWLGFAIANESVAGMKLLTSANVAI